MNEAAFARITPPRTDPASTVVASLIATSGEAVISNQ
jgi:hypothetical protein